MSHIEVNILHQDYILTCPIGQEAMLREAAEHVDTQFQRIRNSSKLRSRERVGVLLAVNLAYENLQLRNQLQVLQMQVTALQDAEITSKAAAQSSEASPVEEQNGLEAQAIQTLIARIDAALAGQSPVEADKAEAVAEELPSQITEAACAETVEVGDCTWVSVQEAAPQFQ